MDERIKKNVIYPYSGIVYVHTKSKVLMNMCYNMGELRKHLAEWKKSDTYDFIYRKHSK